jgi:hypothetical protein
MSRASLDIKDAHNQNKQKKKENKVPAEAIKDSQQEHRQW